MMMMKNPVVLVTCVLLFSALTVLASQGSFSPDECCFKFYPTRLRKDAVLSYKYTDNRCTMAGVLFRMKNGKAICVDPAVQWVQRIMKIKDENQQTNVNFSTTPAVNTQ